VVCWRIVLAALALALAVILSACFSSGRPGGDDHEADRPPPANAVRALEAAARAHQVVLIGEIHGWAAEHRLLRSLVQSPELHVDDVVVEFGNARHQALVDAYVSGAGVTLAEASPAWLETTQGDVWASGEYAEFFKVVRERNLRRDESPLRVVLGDPPLPAGGAQVSEHDFWVLQRDTHFATVIHRQVLGRGRRAVVIAGAGHVFRRPGAVPTLTNLLEGSARCSTDPRSISAGIDWCDDLRRFRSRGSVYVVLPAAATTVNALHVPGGAVSAGKVIDLRASALGRVALARLFPEHDGDPGASLRSAADALLIIGE
jgi:hypothetical protein